MICSGLLKFVTTIVLGAAVILSSELAFGRDPFFSPPLLVLHGIFLGWMVMWAVVLGRDVLTDFRDCRRERKARSFGR